ncbi:MCE family protein [Nocardioides immobilis]|uniref:MCE family protein n=1 Tax=Nocardioides immobilis TaxID=2049295 RepID=A0A417XSB8_9ACTN|nr:MCE family protein [Nocardioides immobilis]RHW22827.1 MCE family protein [Nocardioides immobilis]
MLSDAIKLRIGAVGLVLTVLSAFALTVALYNRAFADPVRVTVVSPRAGLVMDPGNKVKLHGVEIGRVGSVELVDGRARLVLEIDRDKFEGIPVGVRADIRSTTIFGAKYVELVPPRPNTGTDAGGDLREGATIHTLGVTTEVNTVFDSLERVLSGVDVADLNQTLTVLAQTLSGRGGQIADVAAQADAYLTKLQPLLPQLRRDLLEIARFARLALDISPALLDILRNATVTAGTVVDRRQALHQLLVDLSILGGRGAQVLGVNADALGTLVRGLRLPTGTLRAYSTELPCLLMGLDRTRELMADAIGGTDASLRAVISFRSGLSKYTAPADLPGMPVGRGPACHGLPVLSADQVPVPERGEPQ